MYPHHHRPPLSPYHSVLSASPITPRLHLRRLFLRAAIASLAIGGLIAVAALLLNQFDETTGRILGTLVALAFHCGAVIAILHNMDKGRAIPLMRIALALFTTSLAILVLAIWGLRDRYIVHAIATTLFLTFAYTLAIPGAAVLDRRTAPALGWAAVGLPAFALLIALITTWNSGNDDTLNRAAGTAGIAAFTAAQFSLLYLMRATEVLRALYLVTLAAACMAAIGVSILIWEAGGEPDEAFIRVLGAIGVVDACSTLVLIVMARLRGTPAAAAVLSQVKSVHLHCPRCAQEQDANSDTPHSPPKTSLRALRCDLVLRLPCRIQVGVNRPFPLAVRLSLLAEIDRD